MEGDAQEMEKLYSPSEWSRRFSSSIEVIMNFSSVTSKASEAARKNVEYDENIPYGERSNEKYDIYGGHSLPSDAPVFVFFHGGYWMMGDRKWNSFMVQPLHQNGVVSIIVGYTLIPEVTMEELVLSIHKAIEAIVQWAKQRGSRGVYLCGHSAGSHLAAMIMSKHWEDPTYLDLIKGIVHVSGVLNLEPLLQTSLKQQLSLTEHVVQANSPQHLLSIAIENMKANKCRALVLVGEYDSPAFQKLSKEYHEGLKHGGVDTEFLLVKGEDHFSMIEKMEQDDFIVIQKILELLQGK